MTELMRSAKEISELLGLNAPTPEQEAVIEAPATGVYRVIAGAGSGKTETMALRVLYLVANGLVAPQDILGLTFTKKAAGELSHRLIERITLLGQRLPGIAAPDPFDRPKVHTYNAFATRVFSDYSVYLGIDGDVQVASQATAWGLARQVVKDSRDTRLADLQVGVDRVASLVLRLSQTLGENEVDDTDLSSLVERFRALRDLPNGGTGSYAQIDDYVGAVESLEPLRELVGAFTRAKRERGLVEFSDQVRFALDVIRRAPEVGEVLRGTHRVVLLDEYQDTSVLQARLLAELFADHPVTAVGDPHQAIYGWRGASAGNLADFPALFAPQNGATTFSLSISWRNSARVLHAANTLALPLTESDPNGVVTLQPRPDVAEGAVDVHIAETLDEEANAVAQWFSHRLPPGDDTPPTAALLLRNRTHQDIFVRALRAHNIPVHVLGVGGLLSDPVVADLVCGVAVVHRPEANTELVRLLAGGRFRIGVADLYALAGVAKTLGRAQSRPTTAKNVDEENGGGPDAIAPPPLSLIEALDWLRTKTPDDTLWLRFSPAARERLREAANLFHSRRRFVHDDLIDQIIGFERAFGIDIERFANDGRDDSGKAHSALLDAASTYQASSDSASVTGFVDWLQEAEWRDNLQPQTDDAEPGCVQVLTIHGAKGLQWDYVAVPRMVHDELPSRSRDGSKGWLARGELPYALRGDREHLPKLSWEGCESRKEVKVSAETFFEDVLGHHVNEERRLVYVAVTRTKKDVGLFGSWWATQVRPRPPSIFVRELEKAGVIGPLPDAPENDENPEVVTGDDTLWPGDPLGERRPRIDGAASLVLEAIAGLPAGIDDTERAALDGILARHAQQYDTTTPPLPRRLAASSLQTVIADPGAVMAQRSRPTPRLVRGAERHGTDFHEWVESHYREAGVLSLGGDWDIDDTGRDAEPAEAHEWREAFLASQFATQTPLAIEREIHVPIAGHVIVCKIDAVFATDDGVDIIDWKTGRPPKTPAEEKARSLQLSLYRVAWSLWSGTPMPLITAGWWFSRTGEVVRPTHLLDADDLARVLRETQERYRSGVVNS